MDTVTWSQRWPVPQTYDTLCAGSDDEADDDDASEGAADSPLHKGSPDGEAVSLADSDEEEAEADRSGSKAPAGGGDAIMTPAAASAGRRRQAAVSPPHKEQV